MWFVPLPCTFSTSALPKMLRTWCALHILTSKYASRHNRVHTTACTFWASQLPEVLRPWGVFNVLTSKSACNFWFHICPMAPHPSLWQAYLSTLRSHKTLDNTVFRNFSTFTRTCIFLLLTLSLLWSSFFFLSSSFLFSGSAHLCFSICPYCRKFDF